MARSGVEPNIQVAAQAVTRAFRESFVLFAEQHERVLAVAVSQAVAEAIRPLADENRRLALALRQLQEASGQPLPVPRLPQPPLTESCSFIVDDEPSSETDYLGGMVPDEHQQSEFTTGSERYEDDPGVPSATCASYSSDGEEVAQCCAGPAAEEVNGSHDTEGADDMGAGVSAWVFGAGDTCCNARPPHAENGTGGVVVDWPAEEDGPDLSGTAPSANPCCARGGCLCCRRGGGSTARTASPANRLPAPTVLGVGAADNLRGGARTNGHAGVQYPRRPCFENGFHRPRLEKVLQATAATPVKPQGKIRSDFVPSSLTTVGVSPINIS
eukprot:gnl/TRDRNA2_/TRDRNA2_198518_c0_seq1.p1 gnl/TRDRNA2_/TRDRNA2_198518_c0~~gnl/TRDRNA2_/TRDRNA2_198518_c0_seq1.p1  ORF type:complete len:328 (+),score=42.66 gnl/TRDRNA2_/TRDRNA2_198518_c0_seq1:44-1027(+)